jgi:branched-chain amino acid transport system permease protein
MSSSEPEVLLFLTLVVNGGLAGAIYALIALAFVLVYKASRMINFALGEWIMFGSMLAATGSHAIGLGFGGALLFGCAGMALLGAGFNAIVLGRLVTRPVISMVLVTLGLGAVMRGVAALCFRGVPGAMTLPVSLERVSLCGIDIAGDKLVAALISAVCVGGVSWFFHYSRTGIALRAIADDQQAALASGIDVQQHFALVWAATGVISVIAGVLWTYVAGGGFGVALVGLKIFPIVIIGGLDSVAGTLVAAIVIGVLESLGAGYLDPPWRRLWQYCLLSAPRRGAAATLRPVRPAAARARVTPGNGLALVAVLSSAPPTQEPSP